MAFVKHDSPFDYEGLWARFGRYNHHGNFFSNRKPYVQQIWIETCSLAILSDLKDVPPIKSLTRSLATNDSILSTSSFRFSCTPQLTFAALSVLSVSSAGYQLLHLLRYSVQLLIRVTSCIRHTFVFFNWFHLSLASKALYRSVNRWKTDGCSKS